MSGRVAESGMDPTSNNLSQPPALKPPNESTVHQIFIGPQGLRSGWRFVTYVVGFVVLTLVFSQITRAFVPRTHGLPPLWFFLVGEIEQLIAAVLPALALSHLENRPFDDYGLPHRKAFGKNFWIGVLWGFAAITLLLLSMRGLGNFYFGGVGLHGVRVLKFAAFWGVLFLTVGLFEEFVTRGYAQFTLAQGIGFWPAAVLISILFGLAHLSNPGEAWIGALGVVCISLFWCFTLQRTGSLWFSVGMHAAWDWCETFFYSVPDSGITAPGHLMNPSFHGSKWITGGPVGPEGSVLIFVLIAVLWIVFDRMFPAKRVVSVPIETVAQPSSSV